MINNTDDILALDYGAKRIGVARISPVAKLAEPIGTLDATSESLMQEIAQVVSEHDAQAVVVGVPRGLQGQDTEQTHICLQFAKFLQSNIDQPVYCIDEALTSQVAQDRMKQSTNASQGIDAYAAAVFLEDFIHNRDKESLRLPA